MIQLRLIGVIVLSAVFAVATFVYSFYQPFIPGAVSEAIPSRASFVFRVDSLEELLQSPVCGQLDKALGAETSLSELIGSNSWTALAASSEISVADIPRHYAGEQKSWAAVSWVGWRSPWLRWKLEQSRNKKLTLLGKHAVWPVWRYDAPDLAPGMNLTFALTDTLFMACLSEGTSDILLLLDTYDKNAPSTTK